MAQSTHTEAPGGAHEAGPGFPAFRSETYPSQIVWLILAFGVLYAVMSKLALPRVSALLEERAARVAKDLDAAAALKAETDAAIASYDRALADAKAKAQAIATETHERLRGEAEQRRRAVEAELKVRLDAAEHAIGSARSAAMTNVQGIAVDAATAIVERLMHAAPSAARIEEAVAAVSKRG